MDKNVLENLNIQIVANFDRKQLLWILQGVAHLKMLKLIFLFKIACIKCKIALKQKWMPCVKKMFALSYFRRTLNQKLLSQTINVEWWSRKGTMLLNRSLVDVDSQRADKFKSLQWCHGHNMPSFYSDLFIRLVYSH